MLIDAAIVVVKGKFELVMLGSVNVCGEVIKALKLEPSSLDMSSQENFSSDFPISLDN